MTPATGTSALHRLSLGVVRATVSEHAASLRELTVGGVQLVHGTLAAEPPLGAGMVLVPWPNRVEGGRWSLDGTMRQLELTEPELGNANHGLLASTRYRLESVDAAGLTLTAPVRATPGYPFDLATAVHYRLTEDGVAVTHTIRNTGSGVAPVAIGAHPYLRVGGSPVDDLVLTIAAQRALDLDERHIPRGTIDVGNTGLDLRSGRAVRDAVPHASYGALTVRDDRVSHRLRAPDGLESELWADAVFEYVQVYITHDFPGAGGPQTAIAVEPMTAPPNALRSGVGLRWLDSGESWAASWGIRLR